MRKFLEILSVLLAVLVAGCEDDAPYGFAWDKDSSGVLKDVTELSFEQQFVTLNFTCQNDVAVSAHSDQDWIEPFVSVPDGGGYQLSIKVGRNNEYQPRAGVVRISLDDRQIQIPIKQRAHPAVVLSETNFNCGYARDTVSVQIRTNGGALTAEIDSPDNNCSWARILDVKQVGENEWIVTAEIDENTGLGRLTSISPSIDGYILQGASIVQAPALFSEEVNINVPEKGTLQLLMGNDIDNLRRIRKLTVTGTLNMLDYTALKKLFITTADGASTFPISIDFTDCGFRDGNQHPYSYYRWQPEEDKSIYTSFEGGVPSGLFTNAANLVGIKLPKWVPAIWDYAFSGCVNLGSIEIPYLVEKIGTKAFWKCPKLKEIKIPGDKSQLSTLGGQAFDTGSVIESLSFPEILIYLSPNAFMGCKVKEFHVRYEEPEPVVILPDPTNCTLYVPKGTADLYRSTKNWNKYEKIVEE